MALELQLSSSWFARGDSYHFPVARTMSNSGVFGSARQTLKGLQDGIIGIAPGSGTLR